MQTGNKRKKRILVVSGNQYRAIKMHGITKRFSESVEFIYGPGCVLCSGNKDFFHRLVAISKQENVIIATGDNYLKIPGNGSTLEKERRKGREIRTVYTINDVLLLAKHKRRDKIVFPALGFETMAAATAAAILQAKVAGLFNFTVLNGHRPLLDLVASVLPFVKTDALLFSPYDVTVLGTGVVETFVSKNKMPAAIPGDEPEQLHRAIKYLEKQDSPGMYVDPQFILKAEGEIKSQQLINEVFETVNGDEKDIFKTPYYSIASMYTLHDAEKRLPATHYQTRETACPCHDIIKGKSTPFQCRYFKKECNPLNPLGPCMASREGLCQIEFLYAKE